MEAVEKKADTLETPTSVFIGLGPAARTVSEVSLREKLESVVPVLAVRIRGRSAFADVSDVDAARRLVEAMNGAQIGDVHMEVQLSHGRAKSRRQSAVNTALFVGLGPAGVRVSDEGLRKRLEEVAPILGFRRHGQCTFVDVADSATAEKMIQELHNQYIGECRMSVQHSRDPKQSRADGQRPPQSSQRRRRRSRSGERRRHRHRRRRSESRGSDRGRDRRRRRHRRSYSSSRSASSGSSYSSRSSRSSSYASRDRRQRRRRERSRSRSYSSRSRSVSPATRRYRG